MFFSCASMSRQNYHHCLFYLIAGKQRYGPIPHRPRLPYPKLRALKYRPIPNQGSLLESKSLVKKLIALTLVFEMSISKIACMQDFKDS
jgi:hypothetical protein